ncbi:hypothetical protein OTK49_28285 [Vibrio coralliirubri]|uniref:hypothetical protein n=1 Tax=Vibrio coralliirubri TaxID=1516159 RepID=UPI0022848515|nr:hypothetical protein [Vibrio coralliirubri]MCY9866442.1 hypothetical protein [Vibrio coralliirubri]
MSDVYDILREQNLAFKQKVRLEVLFRAYLLSKELGKVTIKDLIDSLGINQSVVYSNLAILSKSGAIKLVVAAESDKADASKIAISFTKDGELSALREVSRLLAKTRFKD